MTVMDLHQKVFTLGQVGPSYTTFRTERLAEYPIVLKRLIVHSTVVDSAELCQMLWRDERLFQLGCQYLQNL